MSFSREVEESLFDRGFSRRHLGRMATLLTAGSLPFFSEFSMAQQAERRMNRAAGGRRAMGPNTVRISSNENPLGPCAEGLEAIYKVAPLGGRYSPTGEAQDFTSMQAETEGVGADHVRVFAGSSPALSASACAFTSPTRSWTMADPGYGGGAPAYIGSKTVRVPLRPDMSHDVEAMIAADPNAGAYYVCNPNNPTGTVTPRQEVEYLLKNKPEGSIVLLDEAYLHFTDEPFGSDLIAKGEDVMVLRTFSKIYGMAGIRAGFAMAKPEILAKMKIWSTGAMPVTGMAAAHASILDKELIPTRKKATAAIRNVVMSFLDKMGYEYTPSVSNKLMIDVRMPVQDFITSMASENIFVGRPWQAWPTWNRVSIGTEEEMGKFKIAFKKVMQS